MAGPSLLGTQPLKTIYTLLAVAYELARFPLWVLLYIRRSGRPNPAWSFSQALRLQVVKAFLRHTSTLRTPTTLSLEPGREADRFVVLHPPGEYAFKGPTADAKIRPGKVGATWTPTALQRSVADEADVVLHFHGGAYVLGNGRDADIGFTARTMLKHGRVTHVFTPAYRLSCNAGGRFPAALQDAITSYYHLIEKLRVDPSKITISGDSAGGNLALALLRYISEHGQQVGLPWPGCVWLWSPWVNVAAAYDTRSIGFSPQQHTDYLTPGFGHWGVSSLCESVNARDPYISPLGNAFTCKSPVFVQTGRSEVLYDDNVEIANQLRAKGAEVQLCVQRHVPHDIILVGPLLGFAKEAGEAAKEAGEFMRAHRK